MGCKGGILLLGRGSWVRSWGGLRRGHMANGWFWLRKPDEREIFVFLVN